MKQQIRRRKKKRRTGLGMIAIVVLLLCGVVSYKRIGLESENMESTKKIQELQREKKSLEDEKKDIKQYEAYIHTDKYVEEVAREKLGLVYKNEIIFEPEDK